MIITTHGHPAIETIAGSELHRNMFNLSSDAVDDIRRRVAAEEYVFIAYNEAMAAMANLTMGYGSTFIARERAHKTWGEFFVIAEHIPAGLRGWQDVFVLIRR